VLLWKVGEAYQGTLCEQVAANVRRGLSDGVLQAGERLPPAVDLAAVLGVNSNTVLSAYRTLRSEGLAEFRRGRGVRVCSGVGGLASVTDAAHRLLTEGARFSFSGAGVSSARDRPCERRRLMIEETE
jgi:GntR family transcriptional regulator